VVGLRCPVVEIRPARTEEYGRIGELTVAAYAALEGMGPMGEYGEELADIAGRGPHAVVLVAADGHQLLGDVTYYPRYAQAMPALTEQLGELAGFRMLATDPQAQGQGVGEALVVECIRRARLDDAVGVALHTTSLMPAAQRLYHRLGFERWTALDRTVGRRRPVEVMGFRMLFGG
jgi:ribosomal protein S18 acetylase RimI-like enzyme